MSSKKIWQYPEATSITNDDYILMDSNTETGSQCLKANKIGAVHITKTVTERKVYKASDDNANGFSEVTVAVPYTDIHYDKDDIVSFVGEDLPLKSVTAYIEPQQDLHGYDAPWVGGSGKNKFDKSTVNVDKYIGADGQLTTSQYNQDVTDFIPVTSGQSYIINSSISTDHYSCFYDANKNLIGSVFANNQFPKVAPSDAKYIRVTFSKADVDTFMVEQGTTASSTYYPYSNICPILGWSAVNIVVSPTTDAEDGHTYTIDLDGTRYGGKVDLVSGVMTVDRAIVDMGDLYWSYTSDAKLFTANIQGIKSGVYTDTNLISSIYPVKPMSYSQFDYGIRYNTATSIGVKNPLYTDATAFKTAMSGVQLVYELTTPLTIQLTPTQVNSLLGVNNVWADTGKIAVEWQTLYVTPTT